jgi:hypothetical protein
VPINPPLNFREIAAINASPPANVDASVPSTLAGLFAAKGYTSSTAALAIGVDPTFVSRVLARRQPLPIDVARALAALLGQSLGTIVGAAGLVTNRTGPAYQVAVPPDLLLGDVITAVPLGRTQQVNSPAKSTVQVWVSGAGLGDGVSVGGIAVLDRALGVVSRTPFANLTTPQGMAFGQGGSVYISDNDSTYLAAISALDSTAKLEVSDANTSGGVGVAYEETTSTIWFGCTGGVTRITTLDPLVSSHHALSIGPNHGNGAGVIAFGGHVYVVVGVGGHPSGVAQMDPGSNTLIRTWGTMVAPSDIASDGGRFLFVPDEGLLWSIDLLNPGHAPVSMTLVGATLGPLQDARAIAFFGGQYWISDTTGVKARLIRFKPDPELITHAIVTGDFEIDTLSRAGHVVVDVDGFVWASFPESGEVRILNPVATSGDPTAHVFATGGAPDALLLV